MPNTHVPAADPGLPGFQTVPDALSRPSLAPTALAAPSGGISRRAMLRAAPAAVAAIAVPSAEHGCAEAWEPWNAAINEGKRVIGEIRDATAETPLGIGIKLCAVDLGHVDTEDYEDAAAAALADIFEATGVDLLAQVEEASGIEGGSDV